MSLYVRVRNSFWTHRKTLRLRAKIGDAAFWVPPRLWACAADNQPDGDFSDYSPEEIATLIGYSADASSMLRALQQTGFMDGKAIHDWQEHNGYHSTFSERAKKAADARWLKESSKEKREYKIRKERRQALLQACFKHRLQGKSTNFTPRKWGNLLHSSPSTGR